MRIYATATRRSDFVSAVQEGLCGNGQKTLPCEYLYDDVGSALFEAITRLPEYGLTRAERRILRTCAPEVAGLVEPPVEVVELGSGSGVKGRLLLEALARRHPVVYHPVDVSPAALERCRLDLFGVAEVRPVEAPYLSGLHRVLERRTPGRRFLVLFLGSSLGNFERPEIVRFLSAIRSQLEAGDAFLLGADLVKPKAAMLAAYDDPAGVTAAFNLNLLARINRELGGTFALRQFEHLARYDPVHRRVEMHLRARAAQRVRVPGASLEVSFEPGETIWTESSHKFLPDEIRELGAKARFRSIAEWRDEEWPFAEYLLAPA
jgi:L-histidine Nalpha-methyltransferase